MTGTQTSLGPESSGPTGQPPASMRKVGAASLLGTTIEFYDFLIFGTAAALVFPKVFFPALGETAGVAASFATLGVAFAARPLGSLLFGHYGDRLGRKRTLVATLLLMGVSTLLVGLVPSTAAIGALAPILIVLLRIVQGVAVGGEWAGAVLFSAEYAPKRSRAFWSNMPSLGGALGTILASATFLVFNISMSDQAFLSWGWRLPFIVSVVLVAVALWVRLSIEETPVFATQKARTGVARVPVVEAFKSQPRALVLASGMAIALYTLNYIASAYLVSYGTTTLQLTRTTVLLVGIGSGIAMVTGQMIGVFFADRIGRRKVLIAAFALEVPWVLALFPIIDLKTTAAFGIGVWGTLVINGIATAPIGAFLSETFETRYRYTATGFTYNIAGVLGGAIPPLVAASIIAAWGSFTFGAILAVVVLISLACVVGLPDRSSQELGATEAPVPARA